MARELLVHDHEDCGDVEPTAAMPPKTALTWLDAQALVGMIDGDPQPLLEWVVESATALSGSAKEDARVRLLARAVASTRAKAVVYQSALDARIAAGDRAGVAMFDTLLTSTTKRLAVLLAEHRASCAPTRDSTISVGHANQVFVAATGK